MKPFFYFTTILALLSVLACEPKGGTPIDPNPDTGTPAPNPGSVDRYPEVTVTTVAGQYDASGLVDANGPAARFKYPGQITFDKNDNLYILN